MAGDKSDQKLAAIITPPVKPREASSNFRFADLKKKTNPAPIAVNIHVNNPAIKACKIGLPKLIKKSSKVVAIISINMF